MKQHSKVKSSAYAPTTINHNSQDILYTNMSNHYRLLLNAKKRVDTSAPTMYRTYGRSPHRSKNRRSLGNTGIKQNLEGLTPSDVLLIQKVAQSEKPPGQPTGYWERVQVQNACPGKEKCPGKLECPEKKGKCGGTRRHRSSSSKKTNDSNDTTPSKQQKKKEKKDRHIECFLSVRHMPLILKTTTSSKIRGSDSYHPPRSKQNLNLKENPSKEMDSSDEYDLGENEEYPQTWKHQQVIKLVQCDGVNKPCPMKGNCQWEMEKSQSNQKGAKTEPSSKVSTDSRDSAYNGGTSSGAESRGATPEQVRRTPQNFSGKCSTPDSGMGKKATNARPSAPSNTVSGGRAPSGCPAACNVSPSPAMSPVTSHPASAISNQPNGNDDVLYATFSHEITTEILKKSIYTDKGINAVINRHIELNKFNLDVDKLHQEADNIRTQIGIQNEEGVQKHLQFAEQPQWQSKARRSISKELSDTSVFNTVSKEMEKKGSNNNLMGSRPELSRSSDSHERTLDDEDTGNTGKLEEANSVSGRLQGVYLTSSGKLVVNIGDDADSDDSSSEELDTLKANTAINEHSSVIAVVPAHASPSDLLSVVQNRQLQVPKYTVGLSTSLPNHGAKQFADKSVEVKPSTNSIETQTDITGTKSLLDALKPVPLAKPRTIFYDGDVVKMAGSGSNESIGCSSCESRFDSKQEVDAEGNPLPNANKSSHGRGEKVSFLYTGVGEAHVRPTSGSLVQDVFMPKPKTDTKLSSTLSDTTLHLNYRSKLNELVANRKTSGSHSVTPVPPRDKRVSVQDKDRHKSLDYYNPFCKAYYNVDALIVNSNVGDNCAGIDNTHDNLSAAEDAATPSKLQWPYFHAVPSSITRRTESNIQESKKSTSKAVPIITPRSFRT